MQSETVSFLETLSTLHFVIRAPNGESSQWNNGNYFVVADIFSAKWQFVTKWHYLFAKWQQNESRNIEKLYKTSEYNIFWFQIERKTFDLFANRRTFASALVDVQRNNTLILKPEKK